MKHIIEKSNFFINVYKYIDKLCYLCLIVALIFAYYYDFFAISFFVIYIIPMILVYCGSKSLEKVAYKINIDTEINEIEFYMLKKNNVAKYDIVDISYVTINGHMYFYIKNICMYWHSPNFNNKDEMHFLETISRFSKIKWGWLCNIDSKIISIKKDIEQNKGR